MKKTLSLFLAMLMLLSVFVVSSFAATAPEVSQITSTFKGIEITWDATADAAAYIIYRDGVVIGTTTDCVYVDANVVEGKNYNINFDGSYYAGIGVIQDGVGTGVVYQSDGVSILVIDDYEGSGM